MNTTLFKVIATFAFLFLGETGFAFAQYNNNDSLFIKDATSTSGIKLCKDVGCVSYSRVNFFPDAATVQGRVTDNRVYGQWWGDEIGWIDLGNSSGSLMVSSTTGRVTGYAWSAMSGWINFAPDLMSTSTSGVWVDANGAWHGKAYVSGLLGGWLDFDCASVAGCVRSAWVPTFARVATGTSTSTAVVTIGASTPSSVGGIVVVNFNNTNNTVAKNTGSSVSVDKVDLGRESSSLAGESLAEYVLPVFNQGSTGKKPQSQSVVTNKAIDEVVPSGSGGRKIVKELVDVDKRIVSSENKKEAFAVFVGEEITFAVPKLDGVKSSEVTFIMREEKITNVIDVVRADGMSSWFAAAASNIKIANTTNAGKIPQDSSLSDKNNYLIKSKSPMLPGFYDVIIKVVYSNDKVKNIIIPLVVRPRGVVRLREYLFFNAVKKVVNANIVFYLVLSDGRLSAVATVVTDDQGEYQAVLPNGNYVMSIEKNGMPNFRSKVFSVNNEFGLIDSPVEVNCSVRDVFGCAADGKAAASAGVVGLYSVFARVVGRGRGFRVVRGQNK